MVKDIECSIDGCDRRPVIARGWCKKHYRAWRLYRDPLGTKPRYPGPTAASLADYLAARYEVDSDGHWQWTGNISRYGYGVCNAEGKKRMAHRAMYEVMVGPIPDGLEIDHLCFVRSCVNPAHLEPVTTRENLQRVVDAGRRPTVYANRKSVCHKGHPLSGPNLRLSTTAAGYERRHCRTCDAAHEANRRPRRA